MWHPSRPKILTFKYRLTQVGKKGNFLRIKSVFVFFFFPLSLRKLRSVQVWSSERDSPCSRPPCSQWGSVSFSIIIMRNDA